MKKPMTQEDVEERASLDGRVAFAIAAFALMAGLIALLDRVGIADQIVGRLGSSLALIGLATIGLLLGSMRVSGFYAAGRALPPAYGGLALAALATGLAIPFAPPAGGQVAFPTLLGGFAGGIAMVALVTGPLLRKTGAFSLPDLLAARYPPLVLRLATIVVVASIAGLVALAGFESAVHMLMLATGIDRRAAIVAIGIVLVLITIPGGVAGVVWSAAAAAGILFAAWVVPIVILSTSGMVLPIPVIGDPQLFQKAFERISEWQAAVSSPRISGDWIIVAAMVIGIGTLAPLFGPAVCSPDRARAQRAGLTGIAWTLVIAMLAAAATAVAALAIDAHVVGLVPDGLPAFIYAASRDGLLRLCGAAVPSAAAAKAACAPIIGAAGILRAQDVAPSGPLLLLGLAPLSGLSLAFAGLIGAGLVVVSLVLAAAGFQTLATTLAHDAFYRVRDNRALTSRRLALTRLALIALIAAAGFELMLHPADPRLMISFAIALSAAAIAPLVALALWPRANGIDATVALLTALAAAEAVIMTAPSTPSVERIAASALIACGVGFIAGFTTSLFHRADGTGEGSAFVNGVLRSHNDVLHPDKGA